MSSSLPQERARRQSLASRLEVYLKARPGEWVTMSELAAVGGIGGWRTRISELRLQHGMHIEHNGKNGAASCHRYLPYEPLGRDASVPAPDAWPSFGAPIQDKFRLT